jgi:hypothetical protein
MFYRLKQAFHRAHFAWRTRAILSSEPISCDPGASCALHTMVSKADLPLYLVAIKSFLRFYPGVGILAHSDGSLRPQDEALLTRHIPGCQVIAAEQADERARQVFGPDSFLFRLRGWDASYRRIIDTDLWSNTPKRIIFDSDILVLDRPQEVIDWIDRGTTPFLMGQPARQVMPPGTSKHIQALFRDQVNAISARLGVPSLFLDGTTGGFYGCVGDELSTGRVERLVQTCLDLGIPMQQWGGEQAIVIYLLSTAGANRLDTSLYFNFDFDLVDRVGRAKLVHFLGYCRYHKNIYVEQAAVIANRLARSGISGLAAAL